MSVFLKKTDLNNMVHHLCSGEQVVRNPKINALIGTKLPGIPEEYKGVLAHPMFTGTQSHESIMWQSDQFTADPTPLSEMTGEERQRYQHILQDAMARLGSAVSATAEPTLGILTQAITYNSLDNVFCGEGKIAITEWGMHPKDNPNVNWLPLGVDVNPPADFTGSTPPMPPVQEKKAEPTPQSTEETESQKKEPVEEKTPQPEPAPQPQQAPKPDSKPAPKPEPQPEPKPVVPPTPTPKRRKCSCKNWWKWLLGILSFLLALLFILFLIGRCTEEDPAISPLPPAIDPGKDISISDDSLTKEVNNRVILLIKKGGTVNEFVKAFRKVYPDETKYQFANPDTVIPRVVLVLPKEEKAEFTRTLKDKFPDWELEVLPETIFEGSATTVNDPAMKDNAKRWYFDMCSVFEAWDETMGDEEIVVAVIDDGFDLSHPEIAGKIVDQYNSAYHNKKVTPSKGGHGMHVAATAVGKADNGKGSAGIAPKCKLMPIQVADKNGVMTTSAIVDAVLYAIEKGADVVNISLGMGFSEFLQYVPVPVQRNLRENNFLAEEQMWNEIFKLADERNVTIVQAGGNENILIGLDPMKRSDKTIKVSAVQPDKYKADFSNFGDYSNISAPGVNIYNAVPGNKYTFMNGTSMASPIVAGGVALLKSKDKSLTTAQIAQILRETGIPSPSDVGPIVNFAKALKADPGTIGGDCDEIQKRYNELLEEIERLKREHPGCIHEPDTMTIPVGADVTDITGTWKSTTKLYNMKEDEVVLYFTFNGTPNGTLTLVEPNGDKYSAPLKVAVRDDKIYIDQTAPAKGPGTSYPPYSFVCRPDKTRHADCNGQNKTQTSNKINFRLVRLNY